jgi:hypothetical protein
MKNEDERAKSTFFLIHPSRVARALLEEVPAPTHEKLQDGCGEEADAQKAI